MLPKGPGERLNPMAIGPSDKSYLLGGTVLSEILSARFFLQIRRARSLTILPAFDGRQEFLVR